MTDAAWLRGWLLQQPRPASLRVQAEDGQVHEIDCGTTRSWAKLAETVAAVSPVQIEALDASKKLLRAVRPEETAEAPQRALTPAVASSVHRYDAETARFQTFATLLADAYRHSSEIAFAKLVELYEVNVQASVAQSREVENLLRLLRKEWEQKMEAADEPDGTELQTMLGALSTGLQAAAAEKSNGKA
jgi:hypothetical protein